MSSKFRGDDDFDSAPISTSSIIGIGQDWRTHSGRTANTWYHNNSSKAIQIYAYHQSAAMVVNIGPSTSSYSTHRSNNRDSSILECPTQPIVPAGHYWRVSHVENMTGYQMILD
jgi:hypothetical protein